MTGEGDLRRSATPVMATRMTSFATTAPGGHADPAPITLPDGWRNVEISSLHLDLQRCESCGTPVWPATAVLCDGGRRGAWVESLFSQPMLEHTPQRCRALRT